MFIKGKCAIYIDKNLRVYENSTVIFVLWNRETKHQPAVFLENFQIEGACIHFPVPNYRTEAFDRCARTRPISAS